MRLTQNHFARIIAEMPPDTQITPKRDIHEMGVPLRDAPYAFAPEQLRAAHDGSRILMAEPVLAGIAAVTVTIIEHNKDQYPGIDTKKLGLTRRKIKNSKARTDVHIATIVEMRERLISGIHDGEFVAYGYVIPRNPADIMAKVPADLFDLKYIKWNKSSIKGAGLEFASVLVFESGLAHEIDAKLAQKSHAQKAGTKRGPPSSKFAIEEAIKSLIDDGTLPNHNQQKDNIEIVRVRVHELHPGEFPKSRGLSKESIREPLAKLIPRIMK